MVAILELSLTFSPHSKFIEEIRHKVTAAGCCAHRCETVREVINVSYKYFFLRRVIRPVRNILSIPTLCFHENHLLAISLYLISLHKQLHVEIFSFLNREIW